MANRGQKRTEAVDTMPADKRACSSLEFRPSSSNGSNQTVSGSAHEAQDAEMETSSYTSTSTRSDGDGEKESTHGSCDSVNSNHDSYSTDHSYGEHCRLKKLLSSLREEGEGSGQLARLTELCEFLSFCHDDALSSSMIDSLSPLLVTLARHESNNEIMLLALRSITYMCDINPRSSSFLVRHDAVPALCQRLITIEYLDVAEQCLQALEKISHEHPLACLQSGGIMAVLTYIDFFSTSTKRVALSTLVNMCKKLSSESLAHFMEAVPILCNLLQYEDRELVESVAICLIKIAEQVLCHSDMLDEMCKHGLIQHAINLIGFDTRTALSSKTSMGLVELLAKLAAGSNAAFRTLLQLNISNVLKDMLSTPSPSHGSQSTLPVNGQKNQKHEVLKLLNALLPTITTKQDAGQKSEKEAFLLENPEVINNLGTDILPALIQEVNSGVNMLICCGCLSIINKLIHFSTSEALLSLLQSTAFPSFLAGVFTRKDRHVILLALHIVNSTMSKLPHIYMGPFVKEGVVFAIHALISSDDVSLHFPPFSGIQSESYRLPGNAHQNKLRCPCLEFEAVQTLESQEMIACTIQKETVQDLGKHILTAYFEAELLNPEKGATVVLQKLRTLSDSLVAQVNQSLETGPCNKQEEETYVLLQQIISELNKKDTVSTFEFVESSVVEALAVYVSSGTYPSGMRTDDVNLVRILEKKFEAFGRLLFSSLDNTAPEDLPLITLIRRLQSALLFVEDFPVIPIYMPKHRNSYALVPYGCCNTYPSLRVRFVKEEGDVSTCKYAEDIVTVDPFVSMNDIEGYLWNRVKNDEANKICIVHKVAIGRDRVCDDSQINSQIHINADPSAKIQVEKLKLPPQPSGLSNSELKITDSVDAIDVHADHLEQESSTAQTGDRVDMDSPECSSVDDTSEKLLFYLEGKKIDGKLSLYQSIVEQETENGQNGVQSSHLWSREYKIVYKRGKGTKRRSAYNSYDGATSFFSSRVTSFVKEALLFSRVFLSRTKFGNLGSAHDILFLLKILEGVQRYGFNVMTYESARAFSGRRMNDLNNAQYSLVSENEFVNKKLTEKLEQLICDPMTVSVGAMPAWCTNLITWFPFLFGFEARCKYFYLSALHRSPISASSTSSQHLGGLNGSQQTYRDIPKKKFVVHRDRVLESAVRMMELYVRRKVPLEVQYNEEVGTGLGPMLEFYTLVCQEFQKGGLYMWRGDTMPHQSSNADEAQNSGSWPPLFGLFPRPWSTMLDTSSNKTFSEVIDKFKLLGQMLAKAIEDGRVLDFPFSKPFYKCILGKELNVHDILSFDPALGKVLLELLDVVRLNRCSKLAVDEKEKSEDVGSLFTKIEDLYLDFSLPGYPDYCFAEELESNMVNLDNLEKYLSLVVDATIKSGIARQVEAFKEGFNQVFNIRHLQVFREEELEHLLCGEHAQWNSDNLLDHIKFDHGYTINSSPITMLLEILREFDPRQQRAFLQFVTGAPRLPTGGLASLNPMLTVVRKHCSKGTDAELPSVMTCANYVKLPPYSSKDIMKEKLLYAITEGQGSFHLS